MISLKISDSIQYQNLPAVCHFSLFTCNYLLNFVWHSAMMRIKLSTFNIFVFQSLKVVSELGVDFIPVRCSI